MKYTIPKIHNLPPSHADSGGNVLTKLQSVSKPTRDL